MQEEVQVTESHLLSTIGFGANYTTVTTADIVKQEVGSREKKDRAVKK